MSNGNNGNSFWKRPDITEMPKEVYAKIVAIIGVLLIIVSLVSSCGDETATRWLPPTWLTAWTDWTIKYVGLVVAAAGTVGVAKAAINKLNKP